MLITKFTECRDFTENQQSRSKCDSATDAFIHLLSVFDTLAKYFYKAAYGPTCVKHTLSKLKLNVIRKIISVFFYLLKRKFNESMLNILLSIILFIP